MGKLYIPVAVVFPLNKLEFVAELASDLGEGCFSQAIEKSSRLMIYATGRISEEVAARLKAADNDGSLEANSVHVYYLGRHGSVVSKTLHSPQVPYFSYLEVIILLILRGLAGGPTPPFMRGSIAIQSKEVVED